MDKWKVLFGAISLDHKPGDRHVFDKAQLRGLPAEHHGVAITSCFHKLLALGAKQVVDCITSCCQLMAWQFPSSACISAEQLSILSERIQECPLFDVFCTLLAKLKPKWPWRSSKRLCQASSNLPWVCWPHNRALGVVAELLCKNDFSFEPGWRPRPLAPLPRRYPHIP